MPIKQILFLLIFFAVPLSQAATCPLGARDTELSIQRVMMNFGRDTIVVLNLARQGLNSSASVTDANFKTTIEAVESAQVCAQAVINATSGPLIPLRANERTGAARDEYVGKLHSLMAEFNEALAGMTSLMKQQQALPAASRDYALLIGKEKELETLASRAHREL